MRSSGDTVVGSRSSPKITISRVSALMPRASGSNSGFPLRSRRRMACRAMSRDEINWTWLWTASSSGSVVACCSVRSGRVK